MRGRNLREDGDVSGGGESGMSLVGLLCNTEAEHFSDDDAHSVVL
jgi:hypothetical protein